MSRRLRAIGVRGYERDFREVVTLPYRLDEPLRHKSPSVYFVNSMSDLFHCDVPESYIDRVFDVMRKASWHTFQVLTKRAERMAEFVQEHAVPENVWLGVSVENRQHGLPRIDHLRSVRASVRFLSIEPLLEDLGEFNLSGIDWVIVGGESGHRARPMRPEWVRQIQRQCERDNVPFFFKQWGTISPDGAHRSKKANGRELDGVVYAGMPISR